MARLNDLTREYEARHFPPTRRLDLQGEGPDTARDRALRWIQSYAHEQPGADLLLIVERGVHRRQTAVRRAVQALLDELTGGLIDWWQPFAEGSLALRIARDPRRVPLKSPAKPPPGEGRTPETAGAAYLPPQSDIPPELLPIATRAAELRRAREGLGAGLGDVVLRGIWNDAQVRAYDEGVSWERALGDVLEAEQRALYEDE